MSEAHVVPNADLLEHRVEADGECVCGPRVEPVKNATGSIGWVVVHHSLDGRERAE